MNEPNELMTIEDFYSASSQSVFDVLNEQQITNLFDDLDDLVDIYWDIDFHSVDGLRKCRTAFYDGVGVIGFDKHSDQFYALINQEGRLLYKDVVSSFRYLRLLHDGIVLLEPYYVNEYDEDGYIYDNPCPSIIIDSKGTILFEGNLGDLSRASSYMGLIILVGSKFTWYQRSIIKNYRAKSFDSQDILCPVCGGELVGQLGEEGADDGLICEECWHHYPDYSTMDCWVLSEDQMQMADYYEDILSSIGKCSKVEDNHPSQDDLYDYDYSEKEVFKEEDFLEEMYALFSVWEKKMLIPFQPCRIKYSRHYGAIYLEAVKRKWSPVYDDSFSWEASDYAYSRCEPEYHEDIMSFDIKYSKRISGEWHQGFGGKQFFNGNVFLTIFDTFRSGPLIGQTLSLAFKHHYKRLWRMLYERKIYITTVALMQLYQKYYKQYPTRVKAMVYERDCLFSFKPVSSLVDSLQLDDNVKIVYYDHSLTVHYDMAIEQECFDYPFFYKVSFEELLQYHPGYIITLIRRNQLSISNSVVLQLDKEAPYYDGIMNALAEQEEEEEKRRREEYEHYCEQLENSYNYEEDTYYALGGDDYQRFKENGGSIDDLMDGMGL